MVVPASIRYKNPGAMWGSALAIKWGATKNPVVLHDGKGQGNNIAVFPNYTLGIAAQQDLWRTSKNYANKRFGDAIDIWSGHNETPSYIRFVTQRVPGISANTVLDDKFWNGPMAIPFLKAQAWHEAGVQYPASEDEWKEGHRRAMVGVNPTQVAREATRPQRSAVTAGAATAAAGAGAEATKTGTQALDNVLPPIVTYGVAGLGIAIIVVAAFMLVRKRLKIFANKSATGDDHFKEITQ